MRCDGLFSKTGFPVEEILPHGGHSLKVSLELPTSSTNYRFAKIDSHVTHLFLQTHMCTSVCTHTDTHIHREGERERETDRLVFATWQLSRVIRTICQTAPSKTYVLCKFIVVR